MLVGWLTDPLGPETEEMFIRSFATTLLVLPVVKCKRGIAFDNIYDELDATIMLCQNSWFASPKGRPPTLIDRLVAATEMKVHLRSVKSDLPLVERIADRLSGFQRCAPVWTTKLLKSTESMRNKTGSRQRNPRA